MGKIRKMIKREKGFTLIELIVVIAILGVLAAMVVPRFVSTTADAKQTAADATVKTIQSAVELYRAEDKGDSPSIADLVTAGYLDENPNDPNGDGDTTDSKWDGTFEITDGKVTYK